jgi:solute carrier family 35 protein C2
MAAQDSESSPPSSNTIITSNFPNKRLSTSSQFDEASIDAAAALAGLHSPQSEMEPDGSGHRRRRSSLMNAINADAKKSPRTRSPIKAGSIQEEAKLAELDELSGSDDAELSDDDLQDDEETGLTRKVRSKRRRRKRRNTLLDQRIVGDSNITAEEKKQADQNVLKKGIINAILIGLWYLFSLSISIVCTMSLKYRNNTDPRQYNKWMFDPKHLDFHFPLFTTCMHMVVQFSLASLVLFIFPQFRPRYDSISNPDNSHADGELMQHEEDARKPLMTKMFYLTRIGPCGAATGLDIGLGNMSLKFITLTFYSESSLNSQLHI